MSYAGLRCRLRLDGEADEERRLVAEHGLFRLTIRALRLAELKERYRAGKSLPSWSRAVPEGASR
jgi:hypothetical protein